MPILTLIETLWAHQVPPYPLSTPSPWAHKSLFLGTQEPSLGKEYSLCFNMRPPAKAQPKPRVSFLLHTLHAPSPTSARPAPRSLADTRVLCPLHSSCICYQQLLFPKLSIVNNARPFSRKHRVFPILDPLASLSIKRFCPFLSPSRSQISSSLDLPVPNIQVVPALEVDSVTEM